MLKNIKTKAVNNVLKLKKAQTGSFPPALLFIWVFYSKSYIYIL